MLNFIMPQYANMAEPMTPVRFVQGKTRRPIAPGEDERGGGGVGGGCRGGHGGNCCLATAAGSLHPYTEASFHYAPVH